MLDFLFELGSSFSWIYRGWIYIISATYRNEVRRVWCKRGRTFKYFDIFMSVLFIFLELYVLFRVYELSV